MDLLAAGEIVTHLDESEQATVRILDERASGPSHNSTREISESEQRQPVAGRRVKSSRSRSTRPKCNWTSARRRRQNRLQSDAEYQQQLEARSRQTG